ncbi:hypothetical protein K1T71_001029 [Dendrolimus kikuchii]|uniref:Uncharacterized protein n=1 Tax=Dendrolimus kikuchii TaxID=765133 RepID=A0ACC1DGH5_9NEOP|nr:hypothetical protein K1T71_001029 [Dendrolimus kikuchii]
MKTLALLLGVVAVANAVSYYDLVKEEWIGFKMEYGKQYDSAIEDKFRMKIFVKNKHTIAKHNQRYLKGLTTYSLKMNKYGDMLHDEFTYLMSGFNKSAKYEGYDSEGVTFVSPAHVTFSDSVDWRKDGGVTPVKDQGIACKSCWAFSSTGALEGQHFRKSGKLMSLSEQNLIDCSVEYENNGCRSGYMIYAFNYIKANGGINTEETYPYEGHDATCRYNASNSVNDVKGFVRIPEEDEQKLMQAVATVGPVSVAIDSTPESFKFYSTGVYYEHYCAPEFVDHAMLVVGYGTDEKGGDYWLVKNSWGATWGDHGYIKMARNRDNNCGIASFASYPLV